MSASSGAATDESLHRAAGRLHDVGSKRLALYLRQYAAIELGLIGNERTMETARTSTFGTIAFSHDAAASSAFANFDLCWKSLHEFVILKPLASVLRYCLRVFGLARKPKEQDGMTKFTTTALAAAIVGGLSFASVGAQALPNPETAISGSTSNPTWVAMSKKKMMMMKKKKMMMKKQGM